MIELRKAMASISWIGSKPLTWPGAILYVSWAVFLTGSIVTKNDNLLGISILAMLGYFAWRLTPSRSNNDRFPEAGAEDQSRKVID